MLIKVLQGNHSREKFDSFQLCFPVGTVVVIYGYQMVSISVTELNSQLIHWGKITVQNW